MIQQLKNISANVLKLLAIALIIILCGIAYLGYRLLYSPDFESNNKEPIYIYINRSTTFEQLCEALATTAHCKRIKDFVFLAEKLNYPENMKTGRYAVFSGMNHLDLLNRLRRGQQKAVRITFNNVRLTEELAERLADQLMITKEEIISLLQDQDFCNSQGFSTTTITTMFIPNTYEMYWNITAENLIARMRVEYDTFWNKDRMEKADDAGLTPVETSILASIVEEESAVEDEYPTIAGLYINRLKKGMLLQADPTVKYSVGDFTLRRILDKHKTVKSPYNTYMHTGLPPGPIRFPSIKAIDAVLNFKHHKYLYMCAKEDFSGRHNFSATLTEHTHNASRYHSELNRRRIR
ncbi:MAG: endolytic transglycosylase MltG [Tannerellaceae bacterium]|jgi:UPF0755 protein|nr:endolytic transglycosylase MltG [Tannerellaceae bacterium]